MPLVSHCIVCVPEMIKINKNNQQTTIKKNKQQKVRSVTSLK